MEDGWVGLVLLHQPKFGLSNQAAMRWLRREDHLSGLLANGSPYIFNQASRCSLDIGQSTTRGTTFEDISDRRLLAQLGCLIDFAVNIVLFRRVGAPSRVGHFSLYCGWS